MRPAAILCLIASGALMGMALDRTVLKLQVGKDIARVFVFVPRRAEHRWLDVQAVLVDDAGTEEWSTDSTRQLDGSEAPVTNAFEFHLPKRRPDSEGTRLLSVRASVVCGTAEARSYVP